MSYDDPTLVPSEGRVMRLRARVDANTAEAIRPRRQHKYRAKATVVDGHRFPSLREARRYQELKLLEKAGEISELELQPSFPLYVRTPDLAMVKVAVYRADFRYRLRSDGWPGNARVVEDVKGVRTETYRLKKKMVECQYGIQIREV